jgi:hypothetical protein
VLHVLDFATGVVAILLRYALLERVKNTMGRAVSAGFRASHPNPASTVLGYQTTKCLGSHALGMNNPFEDLSGFNTAYRKQLSVAGL